MGNEIVTDDRGREIATQRDVANPYSEIGSEMASRTIYGEILRYSRFGEWTMGKDKVEIEAGTRFVVNVPEVMRGWVKWYDNVAVDHRMGRLSEGYRAPPRHLLEDLDQSVWEVDGRSGRPRDPWQQTEYIPMRELMGEKRICTYCPSSIGGRSASGLLYKAFGDNLASKPGKLPVVALGGYAKKHKLYDKVFYPTLNVVSWVSASEFGDLPAEGVDSGLDSDEALDDIPF